MARTLPQQGSTPPDLREREAGLSFQDDELTPSELDALRDGLKPEERPVLSLLGEQPKFFPSSMNALLDAFMNPETDPKTHSDKGSKTMSDQPDSIISELDLFSQGELPDVPEMSLFSALKPPTQILPSQASSDLISSVEFRDGRTAETVSIRAENSEDDSIGSENA